MKDLTQGPIYRHILAMAAPIATGMLLQTLYYVVDLYFVAQLGDAALAVVSAAGNAMFIVLALTQMLGAGTVALMSHAVGRKDRADANHIVKPVGLVFTSSSLFQALGNTWPSLLSSALRLVIFVGPAIWLSRRSGFPNWGRVVSLGRDGTGAGDREPVAVANAVSNAARLLIAARLIG